MNGVADPRDCHRPCRAEEAAAGVEPQTLAPVLARPDAWIMNVALRYQARRARTPRVAPAEPLVTVSVRLPQPNSSLVPALAPRQTVWSA